MARRTGQIETRAVAAEAAAVKVLKFGGTSVADGEAVRRVYDVVASDPTPRKVVVVSAPSGVTGLLLAARDDPAVSETVAARIGALSGELEVERAVSADLLRDLRSDVQADLPAAEKADLLASYGERLAAAIVAAYFTRRGTPAAAVDARDFVVTDATFTSARYLEHPTTEKSRALLRKYFEHGELPVVTGFIGREAKGRTTTLGRGGSDLTATLLGAALGADLVEIWSDADGIMSADPRTVPNTKLLPRLSYEEAVELSNFGARIVFNRSLLPAIAAGLPVRLRNTFNPASPGTLITAEPQDGNFSLTSKAGVAVITVSNPEMIQAVGYLAKLFKIFGDFNLSVDVVAVSEASVSMTVADLPPEAEPPLLRELEPLGRPEVKRGRSLVTVISKYLANEQAILPQIFQRLTERRIDVEMISYGNREINLTMIVDAAREPEAVRLLHELFRANF